MRQIVLDTETTGLDPQQGHRVIEIGAIEIFNRKVSGQTFHVYLNPDREVDAGAMEVHGLSNEFLADKPRFRDVQADFLAFIADAELIIHNAPFDVGFLNAELARQDAGMLKTHCSGVLDTLKMARNLHPGQKNNLDALCRRYDVDNSGRAYHGALLDAELLAEVYLGMTRGQESLAIETHVVSRAAAVKEMPKVDLRLQVASDEEQAMHQAYLQGMVKDFGGAVTPW